MAANAIAQVQAVAGLNDDVRDAIVAALNAVHNAVPAAPAAAPAAAAPAAGPGNGMGGLKLRKLERVDHDSWKAWRAMFINMATECEWTNTRARRMIQAHMDGPAFSCVEHIDIAATPAAGHADAANYVDLLDLYEKVFVSSTATTYARSLYWNSRQLEEESILSWHTRCKRLFKRAYPAKDYNGDPDLIRRFLRGLNNKTFAIAALQQAAPTYDENRDVVEKIVSSYMEFERPGTSHAIQAFGPSGSLNAMGKSDEGSGPNCYVCRKPGHTWRNCSLVESHCYKKPARGGRGRGRGRGGRGGRGRGGGRGGFTGKSLNYAGRSDGADPEKVNRDLRQVNHLGDADQDHAAVYDDLYNPEESENL